MMDLNYRSDQSQNAGGRNSPYTVVTFDGRNYRILSRQHKGYSQMSKIWSVFWFLFGLFMLGTALILFFQQQTPLILTIALGCHLIFTVYAFIKRTQLAPSIYYSSINFLIWMVPIIVLQFLQINQIIIPFCFYITIEMLISIKYMTSKSQMVGKFLVLMEAMMISLKADGKIQSPWRDVLFSHVIFFLFLSLCIIFMTAYLVYMKFKQNESNLMKQKFPGALFIYFNTIAFCLLSAVPLFNIFLNISVWIICVSLSLVLVALGAYIFSYRKKIVIFFCTLNEIKSFDQIISFEPIEEINSSKPEFMKKSKDKKTQPIYLYRISQNWLTLSPQKAVQSRQFQEQNPQVQKEQMEEEIKDTKLTNCTICLDSAAQVVWMPCGHLTVCMECCSFMFEKKNFNCVLCKKAPQQIFLIDTKQKEKEKSQIVLKPQSLQVSIEKDDFSIISGNIILEIQKKDSSKTDLASSIKINDKHHTQFQVNKKAFRVLQGYNVKII